jgi:hypothetical protein
MKTEQKTWDLTPKDVAECYNAWPQRENFSMFELIAQKSQQKLMQYLKTLMQPHVGQTMIISEQKWYELLKELGVK